MVDDWFELLDATITNYGIKEDCIFSMDETCCFLDKSRTKGCHIGSAKQVQQMILRNEARETVTTIPLISANGAVFPPTIIFKGEKGDNWDNSLNAIIYLSSKGYMTGEISIDWIKNDFDHATHHLANGCPWLLIADGHDLHFTLCFLKYAREHIIHILCLPPHTTHAL